jgi:hypothetical protein
MKDIICIILIFFLLGLFIYHFTPLIEGNECETDFEYDPRGETGELPDEDRQKEYNKLKEENDDIYKNENCLRGLINKNSALVKAFKEDNFKPLDDQYKNNLKPTSNSFKKTKRDFNKSLNALYDAAADNEGGEEEEEEEPEETTCGEIDDDTGASPDEDIGKPMPSEGNSCS